MRAVALLSAWKFRNSLKTIFSDPRKCVPIIVFAVLVSCFIAASSFALSQPPPSDTPHLALSVESWRIVVTFGMILLGLSVVDSGLGDGILAFPMPDVDYLFPSPIPRRVVLFYRLPGMMFGVLFFGGFILYLFTFLSKLASPPITTPNAYAPPGWLAPFSVACCACTYLNLAVFVSVQVNDRRKLHRALMSGICIVFAIVGICWWRIGPSPILDSLDSILARTLFFPCCYTADILVSGYMRQPPDHGVFWLVVVYLASLTPMFLSHSNWYEQSIVSSERISVLRKAAKGGYASLMAARSATFRHKAIRTYTIRPFGQGPIALFWAHLCAAAKRPWINFGAPLVSAVLIGITCAFATINNRDTVEIGVYGLVMVAMYASMAFLTVAKAASDGAIRRRDLTSPLPIAGWQAVAANLAVPFLATSIFYVVTGMVYATSGASYGSLVLFGLAILMPLRMAARMTLQYIVVLGYPDFADKIQQVISTWVYMVVAVPFIVVEVIICLPAVLLHSIWAALLALAAVQILFLALLLTLAGTAFEKSIASGEPVRIWQKPLRSR